MATVKYYIRDGKKGATIYVHFNISTAQKFRTTTGLYIDPKDWNTRKGLPKNTAATSKKVLISLQALERVILDKYNETTSSGQTNQKHTKNSKGRKPIIVRPCYSFALL